MPASIMNSLTRAGCLEFDFIETLCDEIKPKLFHANEQQLAIIASALARSQPPG